MPLTTFSWVALVALTITTPFVHSANLYVQSDSVIWDDDNWSLTNTKLEQGAYQSRVTLANGYLGINVAATGPFFEFDKPVGNDSIIGWPLFSRRQAFATIAGFYDVQDRTNGTNFPWLYQNGWDSVISGVPHWSGIVVEADGAWLNASTDAEHISRFSSRLDVGVGVLNWWYTWKPNGDGPAIDVEYRMFVHKLHVNQAAVQLKLTASRDVNVTVYDVLDGDCAVRTDFVDKKFVDDEPSIWTAVNPSNLRNVTAYIYSTLEVDNSTDLNTRAEVTEGPFGANVSSIAQSVDVQLKAENTAVITKFIGGASSDAFENPQAVAKNASTNGASAGFSELLKSHIEEWETILTPDSVDNYHLPDGSLPDDPNIQDLEILAHTNPFFLLQNTVGPNAIAAADNNTQLNVNSIPVCGLGSDCYAGMIFWDSDVWMAPGLQVSHPQHVENLVKYRVEKSDQARENIKTAYSSSKNQTGRFSEGGAAYPWTSGRYGNCTGTGPCFDYQYHLNGDISIMFNNYLAVTGDSNYFKEELLPISNAIAWMFSEALDFNETSGFWELWNATDPDEYANMVNNIGFTTAVFQRQFNETNEFNSWFGLERNESWIDKSVKMRLPINEEAGIIVEYDGMNGSVTLKQADIILIDDFLHYPNEYSLSNLDYYAAKQSADGPAMTYSSYSIVANEISPSGCSSYTYDLYASEPYLRAPWYQFSEQLNDDTSENGGTHPAFPFLTGMGGSNRVGIFGYLGLRLFYDKLDVDPSLPPQIQYLNYRTFYWQGHGINATSNATHTTLSRLPKDQFTLPNANTTYSDGPIPVTLGTRPGTFSLTNGAPLVLENRLVGQQTTVEGNILQCQPVLPGDEYVPGQFPLGAIDGAASTRWQPISGNTTSYITVNLTSSLNSSSTTFQPITALLFDWAAQPPAYYEVLFSNTSLPPFDATNLPDDVVNVTAGTPDISAPYDAQTAFVVRAYTGNQTNVTLESPVWSGRYAHLGIRGNLGGEGVESGGTVAEWSVVAM